MKTGVTDFSVVWIGDAALGERFVARRAPHIRIHAGAGVDAAEVLQQAASREPWPDLLVIDMTAPECDPLAILSLAKSHGLDVPVVLLTPLSGGEDLIFEIGRLVTCDCVVKTPDFVYQLLPAFAQVRARHDLHGVFRTLRDSEEHLRRVIEMQPAVVFTMDADSRVAAINRAGLALLSAGRRTIVGEPFSTLLPEEDQEGLAELIARISAGDVGALEHAIMAADGDLLRVRTQMVSLPRETGDLVLATLAPIGLAAEVQPFAGAADGDGLDEGRAAQEGLVSTLEARVRELEADLARAAALRGANDELVARQQALEHDLIEAESRQAHLSSMINGLEAARDQLSADLSDARTQSSDLSEECGRLTTALEAARALSETAPGQDDSDRRVLAEREHALAEQTQRVATLEQRVLDVQAELDQATQSCQRVEHERAELAIHERALRDDLAAKEQSFTEEGARLSEASREAESRLANMLSAMRAVNDDLVASARAHEHELAVKEALLDDAAREADVRNTQMAATVGDLEAARDRLAADVADAHAQSTGLSAECARLTAELGEARAQVEMMRGDTERHRQTLTDSAQTLADRERALAEESAARERALLDDLASKERVLADDARRDLFELREMLLELVFDVDQRSRTPRDQRRASPSFPAKDRSQSAQGTHGVAGQVSPATRPSRRPSGPVS